MSKTRVNDLFPNSTQEMAHLSLKCQEDHHHFLTPDLQSLTVRLSSARHNHSHSSLNMHNFSDTSPLSLK